MKALHTCILPLVLGLAASAAGAADARPNILWLVSEDNGRFLGCCGDPLARTPTLDRLAREGVLFDRCFAQPVCAPSRFALFSGMYAASCGPAEHMRAQGKIPSWLKGFPALLREAGYFTSNNAKTDYNAPFSIEDAWTQQGRTAHWRSGVQEKKPFFSVYNHGTTHESCLFPEKDAPPGVTPTDPAKVRVPPYQPDTPAIRADWARYYDHMAILDSQIAEKLKDLKDAGLAEDTIVFYYADNGGVLPRSKRFLHQSGTHVPLLMYFPPKWRHLAPAAPGTRVSTPVCFTDFAPTVLSLAGVQVPTYLQGRAFAGPAAATNAFVFCTRDRMDERYDMMRSVMDARWLYIRNFRPDLPYVQPLEYQFRARGYQSWALVAREGRLTPATAMFWGEKPAEELYDMDADPDNVHNLAGDPAQRGTLERMRAALKAHTIAINDNGFMPEGSAHEGYDASRVPGAFPVERAFDAACLASARDAAHVPRFLEALQDRDEAVRWWAAQGCALLGDKAAAAEDRLRACLADPSGGVQVAAAEALARMGKVDAALPVLERVLRNQAQPVFAVQAGNVLDRLGPAARPLLPVLQEELRTLRAVKRTSQAQGYSMRIIEHAVSVLEGKVPALVYPGSAVGAGVSAP